MMAKRKPEVNFYCNICGVRASEPILCVKPGCPTELLVYPLAASVPHVARVVDPRYCQ